MIDKLGTTTALEEAYDLIAEGIDRAGEAKAALFLAKLSLALAYLPAIPQKSLKPWMRHCAIFDAHGSGEHAAIRSARCTSAAMPSRQRAHTCRSGRNT